MKDSLPAPFNLIPSPKVFQKKTSDESNRGSEVDEEYLKTINKLVMRYRKAQKVAKRPRIPISIDLSVVLSRFQTDASRSVYDWLILKKNLIGY